MVMIESKMSSANNMGLDDIKAVDEVLTAPAAASAVAAVQSEQRTPSPARTNSRTKWAGLKSSVSVKSKNGRKKMSNAFPCPMLQSFDLDSPDDSCSNLGLVNRKIDHTCCSDVSQLLVSLIHVPLNLANSILGFLYFGKNY